MTEAYAVRKAAELRDMAAAMNLAMSDPKQIKKIKPPRKRGRGDHPFGQQQKWWKTA